MGLCLYIHTSISQVSLKTPVVTKKYLLGLPETILVVGNLTRILPSKDRYICWKTNRASDFKDNYETF